MVETMDYNDIDRRGGSPFLFNGTLYAHYTDAMNAVDEYNSTPTVENDGGLNEFVDEYGVWTEYRSDAVNSPSHYGSGTIECIEYIEDFLSTEEYIGYLRGNIAKYLHRWRYKNQEEDLRKAQWYLNRLIELQNKTPKE